MKLHLPHKKSIGLFCASFCFSLLLMALVLGFLLVGTASRSAGVTLQTIASPTGEGLRMLGEELTVPAWVYQVAAYWTERFPTLLPAPLRFLMGVGLVAAG